MTNQLKAQFPHSTSDKQSSPEIKRSAFVILYTKNLSMWENHTEKSTAVRGDKSPAFLMVRRSDYMMGFPGGGLKPNDTPLQGAIKELEEELGINFLEQSRLEILSHQKFTNVRGAACETHCFTAEVSPDEFKHILKNAHKAEHFIAETRGLIAVSMEHTAPDKPLPFENFLLSPMPPAVRQDLTDFLLHTEVLAADILRDLINKKLLPPPIHKPKAALPEQELNH